MNRREFTKSVLAGATALAAPNVARSQTVYNLKLGHFISPQHIMSVYLQKWVEELKEKSSGRLNITIFPANTMGPVQNYADYARTGVADITWFLHGATPAASRSPNSFSFPIWSAAPRSAPRCSTIPKCSSFSSPNIRASRFFICSPPARRSSYLQQAGPYRRRHQGPADSICLDHDQKLHRRFGWHSGRHAAQRHCRRAAKEHHRWLLRRLRRRSYRVSPRRAREIHHRNVLVCMQLRRRDESGIRSTIYRLTFRR